VLHARSYSLGQVKAFVRPRGWPLLVDGYRIYEWGGDPLETGGVRRLRCPLFLPACATTFSGYCTEGGWRNGLGPVKCRFGPVGSDVSIAHSVPVVVPSLDVFQHVTQCIDRRDVVDISGSRG